MEFEPIPEGMDWDWENFDFGIPVDRNEVQNEATSNSLPKNSL